MSGVEPLNLEANQELALYFWNFEQPLMKQPGTFLYKVGILRSFAPIRLVCITTAKYYNEYWYMMNCVQAVFHWNAVSLVSLMIQMGLEYLWGSVHTT